MMLAIHLEALAREWTWEPGVVIPIVVAAVWYGLGRRAMRSAQRPPLIADRAPRTAMCYFGGLATLVLALVSPLDAVAEEIFSGHMVQHLLLILAAAPLFVLAAPLPELWWGIPARPRDVLARWWTRQRTVRRAWMLVTAPGVVFALHAVAIWFWHFRGPYEAALHNDALHALEHLSFLGTALLFWWVVIQPVGHRRLAYPAAVLYVVGTMLYCGALGGVLMYASKAWYPSHAAGAAAWGLTPLEDQQLAGLIMWIPAGFVYITTAVWLAWRWMMEDEARNRGPGRDAASLASVGMTVLLVIAISSCTKASADTVDRYVEGGDAGRGRVTIEKYGCGSCHIIPGITQANGLVGPPLIHWNGRTTIAGEIPNEPDRLIIWLQMPQAVEPGTAMPNMGVSDGEARDIAAYLYSIK